MTLDHARRLHGRRGQRSSVAAVHHPKVSLPESQPRQENLLPRDLGDEHGERASGPAGHHGDDFEGELGGGVSTQLA